MKKWILRSLLICLLLLSSWIGYIYNCAYSSKQYNVLIEGTVSSLFGNQYIIGSGVIISKDGYILTAKHCIENIDNLQITLNDGRLFPITDYFVDPNNDIAIIKLDISTSSYKQLSNSNDIDAWDLLYNIGNSNGIWDNDVTFGFVYKNPYKRMFLQDSSYIAARMNIAHGCSGGGVYHYSKLIGIIVSSADGLAFIIPSDICKQLYEKVRSQIESRHLN